MIKMKEKENIKSVKKTINGKTIKINGFRITPRLDIITTGHLLDSKGMIIYSTITPIEIMIEDLETKKDTIKIRFP